MLIDARAELELPPPNMLISSNKDNIARLNKLNKFDSLARAERRRLKENFNVREFFEQNKEMLSESAFEINIDSKMANIRDQYPTKASLERAINLSEAGSDNQKTLQDKLDFMEENGGYD